MLNGEDYSSKFIASYLIYCTRLDEFLIKDFRGKPRFNTPLNRNAIRNLTSIGSIQGVANTIDE